MKFVYLTHSLRSCWNHGNAHFQRGIVRALRKLDHEVTVLETQDGWSLSNLLKQHGSEALHSYKKSFPDLESHFYSESNIESLVDGADVVIVHEWTPVHIIKKLSELRMRSRSFLLFFHDTHHRPITAPDTVSREDLEGYDTVLAFGECLSEVYRSWGFSAFTWHEAADTSHFFPRQEPDPSGVVWIGNWGDGERTNDLEEMLFGPAEREGLPLTAYGVRYPPEALERLGRMKAAYAGWASNAQVPEIFAQHKMTVHVPRQVYRTDLQGIPTIRMFEALACGIPLVSAYWPDTEGLFEGGEDYLIARSGEEMQRHLRDLDNDPDLRNALATNGLLRIHEKHTCMHRARELLVIVDVFENGAHQMVPA